MPMSERLTLPVLPLREVVLFPGVSTPVGAGRPATLRAIEAALKTDSRLIFAVAQRERSEEHTSELQSQSNLVCRLLLEKKKKKMRKTVVEEIEVRGSTRMPRMREQCTLS